MCLIALGKEIVHLSDAFSEIVGLRNRIAHGYFEVDQDTIRNTLADGYAR